MEFLAFEHVSKNYQMGEISIKALDNVNFEIQQGEICIIVGPSGAGKTTLLNILGGMDTVTEGNIWLNGNNISEYSSTMLTKYRRNDIGFVFQFYNLLPNLTAFENVEMAAQLSKDAYNADDMLDLVGLKERRNNFPSQLSGGEQQRVSIARALVKKPKLLLCDEPTGALDYSTGKLILELLQRISKENNMTVIIVTHNQAITAMADRIIKVNSGKIVSNIKNENIVPVQNIEW